MAAPAPIPAWRANLGLKALSLVLGFSVWLYVNSRGQVTYNFAVPIVTTNLPEQMVLVEMDTDTADVQLSGRESTLSRITTRQIRVPLDLSSVTPGESWIGLRRDTVAVPELIEVTRLSPRQVRVVVERRMERTVGVVADLSGEPAEGVRIDAITVSPPEVTLTGAESAFYGLLKLRTEPIDLTGLDRSLRREVRLDLGGRDLEVRDGLPVYVTITVKRPLGETPPPSPEAVDNK